MTVAALRVRLVSKMPTTADPNMQPPCRHSGKKSHEPRLDAAGEEVFYQFKIEYRNGRIPPWERNSFPTETAC